MKLRLVVERRTQTAEFPNDIRGLGKTGLLDEQYPWSYLAIDKAHTHIAEHVAHDLHLHLKQDASTNSAILFEGGKAKNHKQKSLRLFGAAILMAHHQHDVKMMLSQVNILHLQMHSLPLPEHPEYKTKEFTQWTSSHRSEGLLIHAPVTLYLAHAGFSISEEASKLQFKSEDLMSIQSLKQTHSLRKAA